MLIKWRTDECDAQNAGRILFMFSFFFSFVRSFHSLICNIFPNENTKSENVKMFVQRQQNENAFFAPKIFNFIVRIFSKNERTNKRMQFALFCSLSFVCGIIFFFVYHFALQLKSNNTNTIHTFIYEIMENAVKLCRAFSFILISFTFGCIILFFFSFCCTPKKHFKAASRKRLKYSKQTTHMHIQKKSKKWHHKYNFNCKNHK